VIVLSDCVKQMYLVLFLLFCFLILVAGNAVAVDIEWIVFLFPFVIKMVHYC